MQDELFNRHFIDLQRLKTFEVGLIISLHGAKSDTIVRFIRSPDIEEGQANMVITPEWVLEHAAQVSKMLSGGLVVLGVYVLAPTSKLSSYESKLLSIVSILAQRVPDSTGKQAVVLQLPTDARKPVCRTLEHGVHKLQPAELKMFSGPLQVRILLCTSLLQSDRSHTLSLSRQCVLAATARLSARAHRSAASAPRGELMCRCTSGDRMPKPPLRMWMGWSLY